MNCSYVHTDKTNGRKTPCSHPVYQNTNLCVFHSPAIGRKDAAFALALGKLLAAAESSEKPTDLDFKGFFFPQTDFGKRVFRGVTDFRGAIFTNDVTFRGATFLQTADFHTTEFLARADFHAVVFASVVRFLGTKFGGRSTFSGIKFKGRTAFHGCKFAQFTTWQASKFDIPVLFQGNTFGQDVDFRQAVFYGGVDFDKTLFRARVNFEGTRFHDEVILTNTHIELLKKLRCPQANMEGAVLHTAQIWENEELRCYSFRNAFLISVNLAGKTLFDCDFTGAVFRSVLTVGWRLDRRTLTKTKFIYTDYRTEEVRTSDGEKRRVYFPVLDSRVPADGNFAEGEHANFTLADYLRQPVRMNMALNVPSVLRTAVTNYLQLFTDFLKVTQGVPVELRTRVEGTKLRVEFLAQTEEDLAVIREAFAEYQKNTGRDFNTLKLNIAFNKNTSPLERELFLMKFESQINLLRTELTYTKALLSKSDENRALLARLVEASRSPRILLEPINTIAGKPLRFFCSYSHKDDELREQLEAHLAPLKRQGQISTWYDRRIIPGHEYKDEIDQNLNEADVILLLVSADFINSDYCYEIEMATALKRHQKRDAKVVPIIIRTCNWQEAPFAKLKALPKDGYAVTLWDDRDEAWTDVSDGIRKVVEELREG